MTSPLPRKIGIIAGGGELPALIMDRCLREGVEVSVAAVKGEADPEIETGRTPLLWLGVGQLGKMVRFFKKNGVHHAFMAGQVRHVRIFGKDHPDLRMLSLLVRLARRNTDSLLGAIASEMEMDGISLMDTTLLLPDLTPEVGVLTKRQPDKREQRDIDFGREIAVEIARLDIGQTVVVRDRAVVAVEAMEGTDAAIQRAAELCDGKKIVVVKVCKPNQDMRFDVPIIGPHTIETCVRHNVSALSVDAGKSLILQKKRVLSLADESRLAMVGRDTAQ